MHIASMVTDTLLKTNIVKACKSIGRKGSYVVEAAIALPIFLMAMTVLGSIVLYYASIEDANFILATELRKSAIEAQTAKYNPVFPAAVQRRIRNGHSVVKQQLVTDYAYRAERDGNDELIALTIRMNMKTNNPLGLGSRAAYDAALITRAYTGKIRDDSPMDEDDFQDTDAEAVFIFPKEGERYHDESCTFVRTACTAAPLTRAIKKEYDGCPLCGSREAAIGSLVYYFPKYGDSYHLPGCSVLQRNCIEVERGTAKKRGYTPCAKCGG